MLSAQQKKKRWQNIRRRTNEKVTYNRRPASQTAGGCCSKLNLSKLEEQMQQAINMSKVLLTY